MSFLFGSTKNLPLADPTPFGAQTSRLDTNQSARILPWFAGVHWMGVTWLGDVFNVRTTPIVQRIGKHDSLTGYNYYASFAAVISNGPADFVLRVKFDDEVVWSGSLNRGDEDFASITIPNRGIVRFGWGTETQGLDSLLAGSGQEHSPYRGQFYLIGQDIFFGADKTNAPNIQILAGRWPRPTWIPFSERDSISDANPVGILHDLWTGKRFGLGRDESELDIPRLQAASTRLWNEGNFVSPFFDSQTDLKNALVKMFEYFDAYPTTYGGKFGFELVRPVTVNIPLLTKSSLLDDPEIQSQTWPDTFDEVRVKYTDYALNDGSNSDNLEKHHELANFVITGRHNALELDRPWTTRQFQAAIMAGAAGRVSGLPQSKGTLKVRKSAVIGLTVGGVFDLQTRDGSTIRMRVTDRQEPDPDKSDVELSFESDRGWANAEFFTPGQDAISDSPTFSPLPVFAAATLNAPFAFADSQLASLLLMAARNEGYSTSFDVWRATNQEGPYASAAAVRSGSRFRDFAVKCKLRIEYPEATEVIDQTIGIAWEVESPDQTILEDEFDLAAGLDHTILGFFLNVAGDITEVMSLFDLTRTTATQFSSFAVRGLYDTRRRTLPVNTEFWIQLRNKVDSFAWSPFITDPRYFKFQTFFGRSGISLADVDAIEHAENGRSLLPIAPMNVRLNGDVSHAVWDSSGGDSTLTWNNTSRARTVYGLAFNESPATDLTSILIELRNYAGNTLLDSFEVSPTGEQTTLTHAYLLANANADFQLRAYGLRSGFQSLDYTSVLVRKV